MARVPHLPPGTQRASRILDQGPTCTCICICSLLRRPAPDLPAHHPRPPPAPNHWYPMPFPLFSQPPLTLFKSPLNPCHFQLYCPQLSAQQSTASFLRCSPHCLCLSPSPGQDKRSHESPDIWWSPCLAGLPGGIK